jgi:hypothetical protein
MPIGNRPVPSVAKGKSNTWRTKSGQYNGTRGTKSPMGSRPVPTVARNTPKHPMPRNATKPAVKGMKMGRPRAAALTSASRATGGGKGY